MSERVHVKALSDLHGFLPEPEEVGACDLLLIAGDVCPAHDHFIKYQISWLGEEFSRWLESLSAVDIVWVAGNHDFAMEWLGRYEDKTEREELIRWMPERSWYLQDGYVDVAGLRVFGTPWSHSPDASGWAFDAKYVDMTKVWADCPDDADVVVSHGPPAMYGDRVGGNGEVSLGTFQMLDRVLDVEPQLTVYGHNHEGYGRWDKNWGVLANVSYLTDRYYPGAHPIQEFWLEPRG